MANRDQSRSLLLNVDDVIPRGRNIREVSRSSYEAPPIRLATYPAKPYIALLYMNSDLRAAVGL